MFSFLQLCEELTQNQRYSWFCLSTSAWNAITPDERLLVKYDDIDESFIRIWYPASKYQARNKRIVGISEEDKLKKALMAALKIMDFDEIENIKQKMKEVKK